MIHTTTMIFHMNSYKGKWFVLDEEEDDMFGSDGTVDEDNIDLTFIREHAKMCEYYGIPMYTGKNKNFRSWCDDVMLLVQSQSFND